MNSKDIVTTHVVRVIAKDQRYKEKPYPAIPVLDDGIGTYITGQHIVPGVPETENNLTKAEMVGSKELTVAKKKKFPYIINPENPTHIFHEKKLNLSKKSNGDYVNTKDKALFDFFLLQRFVSPSLSEFREGYHYFYIEDKEKEADESISKEHRIYKAMHFVKEHTSIRSLEDIALYLNYKVNKFHIPLKVLSKIQLESKILDACKTHPDAVSECFSKSAKEIMYVLKLVDYDIVSLKSGSFYDGDLFIGNTPESILDFIRKEDNKEIVLKWGENYRAKEGIVVEGIDDREIATNRDKVYADAKESFERDLKNSQTVLKKKLTGMSEEKLNAYAVKNGIPEDAIAVLDTKKLISLLVR